MYIDTTQAASLLEISPRRLRQLLQQGRVKGAYKAGQFWLIPLYRGLPYREERKTLWLQPRDISEQNEGFEPVLTGI